MLAQFKKNMEDSLMEQEHKLITYEEELCPSSIIRKDKDKSRSLERKGVVGIFQCESWNSQQQHKPLT